MSFLTLTTAREIVRRRLKSGNDTDRYADEDIDDAILLTGNDFVTRTGCTLAKDTVSITAASDQVDFSSIDGFRPEFMRQLSIVPDSNYVAQQVAQGIDRTDFAEIQLRQGMQPATSIPTMLGFTSLTQATIYPTPQYSGTLSVLWAPPFVSFTPGTATPDDVTLNIPADMVYAVLIYGATVIVQLTEVENIEKVLRSGAYEAHVQRSMGRGGLGAQVMQRLTIDP